MDAQELEWLREDIETLLPDRCELLTVTRTSDGIGGWSETWATASANVPCRLDEKSGRRAQQGAALEAEHTTLLSIPFSETVTTDYRVKHAGITYTVASIAAGSWMGCKRLTLEVL